MFPINDPVSDVNGVVLQKRDRQSYAILHQPSAEWRGEFFDDRLTTTVGLRMPFFTRDLDNNCFTSSASNSSGAFVECSGGNATIDALIAAENPYVVDPVTGAISGFSPPQERKLKYEKLLPNIGFIYDITPSASIFANYAKGLSVPSTDNLYASFFFPEGTDQAKPKPEETDSFDFGARYRSSKVQAQVGVWKTRFKNRSAVSFDPEANTTVFRNLGTVDKWGIDGSVAYSPIRALTLYAFAAWNDSEIKDNIQISSIPVTAFNPAGTTCDTIATGRSLRMLRRRAAAPSPPASVKAARRPTIGASRRLERSVRSTSASPPRRPVRASSSTTMRSSSAATSTSPGWGRRSGAHLQRNGPGLLAGQPRRALQLPRSRAQGNLLPAQRLQSVRRGLCRRVHLEPQPGRQLGRRLSTTPRSPRSALRAPSRARSASLTEPIGKNEGGVARKGGAVFFWAN